MSAAQHAQPAATPDGWFEKETGGIEALWLLDFSALNNQFTLSPVVRWLIEVFVTSQDVRQKQISSIQHAAPCFSWLFVWAVCETSCHSLKWNERDSRGSYGDSPSFNTKDWGMTSSLHPKASHQGLICIYKFHQLTSWIQNVQTQYNTVRSTV